MPPLPLHESTGLFCFLGPLGFKLASSGTYGECFSVALGHKSNLEELHHSLGKTITQNTTSGEEKSFRLAINLLSFHYLKSKHLQRGAKTKETAELFQYFQTVVQVVCAF